MNSILTLLFTLSAFSQSAPPLPYYDVCEQVDYQPTNVFTLMNNEGRIAKYSTFDPYTLFGGSVIKFCDVDQISQDNKIYAENPPAGEDYKFYTYSQSDHPGYILISVFDEEVIATSCYTWEDVTWKVDNYMENGEEVSVARPFIFGEEAYAINYNSDPTSGCTDVLLDPYFGGFIELTNLTMVKTSW